MTVDVATVTAVAADLAGKHGVPVQVTACRVGLSGASVFRVRMESGSTVALKRLPAQVKLERVREIHGVADRLATCCRQLVNYLPFQSGDSLYRDGNRWWEATQWRSGEPLPRSASESLIRAGAETIARTHGCASEVIGSRESVPQAILDRIERTRVLDLQLRRCGLVQGTSASVANRFSLEGRLAPDLAAALVAATELLGSGWAAATDRFLPSLKRAARSAVVHYVLRDGHRENVLFDGDQVSGLIDLDALRIDTPAIDVARWVSGFFTGDSPNPGVGLAWDGEKDVSGRLNAVWNAATAGFASVQPLDERTERTARLLLLCSAWITLANWVVWLGIERRSFGVPQTDLAERIDSVRTLVQEIPTRWED
ncbi:MAG: phosphotransferase [Planctomycetota bacterium]